MLTLTIESVVGENHQRYCVYKLVDDVPQADVPALVHSGQSYFEAYRTYLENTDVPVTDDEAEEDTLLATITKYQTQVDEGISTAKADYTKSLGEESRLLKKNW